MKTSRIKYLLPIFFLIFSCSAPTKGVIIFCAGDSITEAAYPNFLQKILNKEKIKAKVLNYGRSGNTTGEYLNFLKNNKNTLAEKHPDFILLQLGTNDVRIDHDSTSGEKFYSNMKKILKIFQRFKNSSGKKTKILLATIPPIPEASLSPFSPKSAGRVTEEINPLIKKISAEEKIDLVDNYTLFIQSPHLLPEVHPTREGYRVLAQNWFNSLKPMLLTPSNNTFSGKNLKIKSPFKGKIVFQSNMDGDDEIYVLKPDGLKKLTDNSWDDSFPVWSPDGKKIAFTSNPEGNFDIFIMKADGSEKTQLTFSKHDEKDPSWFPDGKKIVYSEEKRGILRKKSVLFLLDIQSKKSKKLIPEFSNTHGIAHVSPFNSNWITFTGKRTMGWDAAIFYREKNTVQFLQDGGKSCRGRFSRDGEKIAYVNSIPDGKGDIWLMNPDGTQKKSLIASNETYDYFPSWSPDGNYIVFCSSLQISLKGDWELCILEISTGKVFPLFDSPGSDIFPDWQK